MKTRVKQADFPIPCRELHYNGAYYCQDIRSPRTLFSACVTYRGKLNLCLLREGVQMNKKLYRVKVVLYVMAENESEARVAATNAKFDIFECTAKKAEYIEQGWDSAIPYNADDDRTCMEVLGSQQQFVQPATSFLTQPQSRKQTVTAVPYVNL
jgi:hypothetical protein